jgi:hypothetical protein
LLVARAERTQPGGSLANKGILDSSLAHGDLLAQDDINAELKLWPAAADFL